MASSGFAARAQSAADRHDSQKTSGQAYGGNNNNSGNGFQRK
jgi:hypothetical protein